MRGDAIGELNDWDNKEKLDHAVRHFSGRLHTSKASHFCGAFFACPEM